MNRNSQKFCHWLPDAFWVQVWAEKNILSHTANTILTYRLTFKILSALHFFVGSASCLKSLFSGDASASQQMNCSTVIASPLDRHSCLDIKICGFETSRLEEGLTCSVKETYWGKNTENTKKQNTIFFTETISSWNLLNKKTGLTLAFPDLWLTSEDYMSDADFNFLLASKNNPFWLSSW